MNNINLKTGYLVAAFPNFESAYAATGKYSEDGYRIVYLNEVACIRDREVESFVLKHPTQQVCLYHNYRLAKPRKQKQSATESLRSALKVLEKKNKQRAKFVMIVSQKSTTAKAAL
ncbi:hypothetical protein H8S95_03405 [Pontibacter sp. KCTC 32443]|uniref:hypothetical protein n=1 Tax=Pontibacter TaxID=323449 RepID=UPI00164E98F0|nr:MULTISPECIES: hypothetical protein [Pontibacter]MBC5773098.1 hypothetical protein [Pontibacter sp. KCTC 32443]